MPIPRVGQINKGNVRELRERLRRDESLRREAIGQIKANFHSFLVESFELTDEERAEMLELLPDGVSEMVGQAVVVALETGGDVNFEIRRGRPSRALKLALDIIPGSITATCSIEVRK